MSRQGTFKQDTSYPNWSFHGGNGCRNWCHYFFHMLCFHIQHGETAIHLVAKYNHANVIAAFASFKVNVNIGGKVTHTH